MDAPQLKLMPRDEFSALKLHEKNDYLQQLANDFALMTGREHQVLDKDVLSRLRRYYSRGVWADLKLDSVPDTPLNRVLRRLGEAIRSDGIRTDVTAVLHSEIRPKRVLRQAPDDDAQLMFFVPSIYDAPIKDNMNLMDVAPFSLGKKARAGVIKYELKDSLITVEGGAEVGLATVFDYDIVLHMVSYLAEEVRRYGVALKKGLRPNLPARVYRPNVAHILKFARRRSGGRQYEEIEAALRRLKATNITIANLSGGKRREVRNYSLIADYRVVSKTSTGKVDQVEIEIPEWIYADLVRDTDSLPLLTIHNDYFLMTSGIGRTIYRLARRAAGKTTAKYGMRELYKRSGSTQEFRYFVRDVKEFVKRTQVLPMPEYDLSIEPGKESENLIMKIRQEGTANEALPRPV